MSALHKDKILIFSYAYFNYYLSKLKKCTIDAEIVIANLSVPRLPFYQLSYCAQFFAHRIRVIRLKFQIGLLEFPDVDYQFSGLLQILNRSFIKTPVLAVAKFFAQSMLIHPNRYALAQNFLYTVGSEIRPFKIQTFWWSDFEWSCIQFVSLYLNDMFQVVWAQTILYIHKNINTFLPLKIFKAFIIVAQSFVTWSLTRQKYVSFYLNR